MKQSAGILLYNISDQQELMVLLVHPGGPFWAKKDEGAWSVPKGEFREEEESLNAAIREFSEETGHIPNGKFIPLKPLKQKSGKLVHAWALKGELDAATIISNTFKMEWPPKSGKEKEFPEIDKAEWFNENEALLKILPSQKEFITELKQLLNL